MSKGYGELKDKIEITTQQQQKTVITIAKNNNKVIYTRKTGNMEIHRIIGGKDIKVTLQPVFSVFYPDISKQYTEYILIKLRSPIDIAPQETLKAYTTMPVDIGVTVSNGEKQYFIDLVFCNNMKLALYGSVNEGIIARYHEANITTNKNVYEANKPGLSIVELELSNRLNEWVTISKILVNVNAMKLCYKPSTWQAYTSKIVFTAITRLTANIAYHSISCVNAVEALKPHTAKLPVIKHKTSMPWGY